MAHQQQIDFCTSVRQRYPEFFNNRIVLDIGSLDINGNNQYLFDECLYLGIDLFPGKNVDLVSTGHSIHFPDESIDTIISSECFEHDQFYPDTLKNIIRMLKPGGAFIFTCATTGRPEHGTRRTTPDDAPFIQSFGEWADYYKNLEESDIRKELDVDAIFEQYEFSTNSESKDLYFWGLKKGRLEKRSDYSFQLTSRDNLKIQIRALENELSTTEDLLEDSKNSLDIMKKVHEFQIESYKHQLEAMHKSMSWRFSAPLRWISKILRTAVSKSIYLQALVRRTVFVCRQFGLKTCVQKIFFFGIRYCKSKLNLLNFYLSLFLRKFRRPSTIPTVSFIIPIYDRTDVLRTAIQSVLKQSSQNFELILVTDGSPQSTLDVVNEFAKNKQVKIFNYPKSSGNAVRGRNKGILEASGKYIAFLDSDDIAAPHRIALSLPLLESDDADVVYGAWRALLDGSRTIDGLVDGQLVHSPNCDFDMLKSVCVPCQSTVMLRKDVLYQTGFLKPQMNYREDHELWLRIAHHGGKFKAIDQQLTTLRLHQGNNELNFKGDDEHWQSLMLAEYTKKGPIPKKIAFILEGLGISGGLIVILKHANYLMSIGHDVLLINTGSNGSLAWFKNNQAPVVHIKTKNDYLFNNIDILFATFWTTCAYLDHIEAKRKLYFVQSDERLFYDALSVKEKVHNTYLLPIEFVTISNWITEMLGREFSKSATTIPNGIDASVFYPREPLETKNRLRVLIEGPIDVPFKGMMEAYAAIESLDCEIWIVSSSGSPAKHWRYDRFFQAVSQEEMASIYSSCDILLKMSRVESFSFPPLEAMACGCAVVVAKVDGAIEYLEHNVNALVLEKNNINQAKDAVATLLKNDSLRNTLIEGGYETAKKWKWESSFQLFAELVG